jgi:hypothetical protein
VTKASPMTTARLLFADMKIPPLMPERKQPRNIVLPWLRQMPVRGSSSR